MPRHFYKTMMNPYFHSDHYKNSPTGQLEQKIEKKLFSLSKRLKKKFGKKVASSE
jgi:hypothetical protein